MKLFLGIAVVLFLFFGDFVRLGSSFFKIIALVSLAAFFLGFWSRISVWFRGRGDFKGDEMLREAIRGTFSKECILASRLFRESKVRGIVLVLTIWSFMVLTLGSISLSLEYSLRTDLTSSRAFSFLMDCSGVILLFCIIFYLLRRVVVRSARSIAVMDDAVLLCVFSLIVISGLAVKGLRIAYAGASSEPSAPVGSALSGIFLSYVHEPTVLLKVKDVLWKLHALSAFFFFAYVPFSKQFHMFAAQLVTKDAERRKKELRSILHD